MSVLLKADVPQDTAFTAGAGATSPVAWTYNVADTSGVGGVLANSPVYVTRPGQAQTLTLTARVPVTMPALALTVTYTYYDVNLAALATGTVDSFSAVTSTLPRTVTLPDTPSGARYWNVSLVLNEGISDTNVRTNLFTQPRGISDTTLVARNSWSWATLPSSMASFPIPGITTYPAGGLCTSAATGTYRGVNLWQAPDGSTPTASTGFSVSGLIGQTLTFSTWVWSSKSATFQFAVRFFSGTTWTAAATTGASVAVPASTWTRVSVTAVVPTGAAYMCAAVWVPASTAWAVNDVIGINGVLLEVASSVGDYFDGTYNPTSYAARWLRTVNGSASELYIPGMSRNRVLNLSAVTLFAQAVADEIINAQLKRPLRRSVYDALNVAAPQIAVGTPGLLAGSLTYLCETLADALSVDTIYQFAGAITLVTGGALDGFVHMAVDDVSLTAEKALPGKESRWLVQASVREIKAAI